MFAVAPPTGSVDRNIESAKYERYPLPVAPPTGSVDRNVQYRRDGFRHGRRSPHGERG